MSKLKVQCWLQKEFAFDYSPEIYTCKACYKRKEILQLFGNKYSGKCHYVDWQAVPALSQHRHDIKYHVNI